MGLRTRGIGVGIDRVDLHDRSPFEPSRRKDISRLHSHDARTRSKVAGDCANSRERRANFAHMTDMQPKRLTDYANCAG